MEANSFIPLQRVTEFNRLIDQLLAEPFSVSQKLEDATLEALQTSFEEIDEAFSEGAPPPELSELRDSYGRSKELFCLILMELESMHATGAETLHELRHRDMGTQILTPRLESSRAAPPPAAPPTLTLVPPPKEEDDLFETMPPASASPIAMESQDSELGEEDIHWSSDLGADAKLEFPVDTDEKPALPPPVRAPTELPDFSSAQMTDEPEHVVADDTPPAPVAEVSHHPEEDPRAAHFLKLAERMQEQIDLPEADRFEAQCRLFAVECSLWFRLGPSVRHFWPKKESAIRELLDSSNKRFDFHPVLKKGLETLAKENQAFLPERGLPYASILNSVRFLLSSPQWDAFWPLPVELGMLILLFGGERSMRGLILKNHIEVRGLTPEEGVEIAFRLFRCQQVRNQVLSPKGDTPPLETFREDCARLLELAAKVAAGHE